MNIQLLMQVGIPVGHRVRVRWYRGADGKERPLEPVVEDLETGILYATDWCFECPKSHAIGGWMQIGTLLPGMAVSRELIGRVTGCRVQLVGQGYGHDFGTMQTELTVDAEPSHG